MKTEVEQVIALRKAFVRGANFTCFRCGEERGAKEAAKLYPMPTVAVPRVITITAVEADRGSTQVRVVNGQLQFKSHYNDSWDGYSTMSPNRWGAAGLRAIADLFDNPTEQVPADDPRAK